MQMAIEKREKRGMSGYRESGRMDVLPVARIENPRDFSCGMPPGQKKVGALFGFLLVPLADQLKRFLQHRAGAGAIGFSNQRLPFHLIQDSCGPAITNT